MPRLFLAALSLCLCGCPARNGTPGPPDAGVKPAPRPTAAADAALSEPPFEQAIAFEAELEGVLHAPRVKAAKYVALVTPDRCDPALLATAHASALAHPDPEAKKKAFRVEPYVKEGSVLHLCGLAFDATGKRLLGFGQYAKNPIVFHLPEGHEEIELEDLEVTIEPLKTPIELPEDRF